MLQRKKMKKIILFSPTGYIGSLLKEYLLKEKDTEHFEITRNNNLNEYFEDYDIMIYSASVINAESSKLIQDNVLAALSSVDFCKKHNVKRIIYLSTDSLYGELNVDEVSENTIMVNPDFYGTTKYLAEKIIIESGIPYYILRLPGVVGRIWRGTYLYRLIDKAYSHESITLYNGEKKFNNVLDVDDLVKFVVHLCSYEKSENEIFLLGNTEKIQLIKIVDYIKDLCHSTSKIDVMSGEGRRYFTLNVDKAVAYGYSSKLMWNIIDELYRLKNVYIKSTI